MVGFLSSTNAGEASHSRAEGMSMFFDFQTLAQHSSEFIETSSPSRGQDPTTRTGIRVSLACIPCRSRHVKCGAETPSCTRCLQEDKQCFYAKSRRGMRDKNVPQKRESLREVGKTSPDNKIPSENGRNTPNSVNSANESYSRQPSSSSSPGLSPKRDNSKPASARRLLDLYYRYFHKAHPFALPRYYFLSQLQSDPESLRLLSPIMQFIGSRFSSEISSRELKETAMNQLNQPTLPPNGFTVLALLLAAIVTHCEADFDNARILLDRAVYLALELGMNSRVFAAMERDPVLAESWRRVYWGLYVTAAIFSGIKRTSHFILHNVHADVELPCEEAEYDGVIPRPKTLEEYDGRDFEDEAPTFSSFAYLIDLSRIFGSLLLLDALPISERESAVANADTMLVNWKLHLPPEKHSVVDKNEEIDEILFQAQNLLQILFIYIHRPLSRLYHSPIEIISQCAPPPPSLPLAQFKSLALSIQKEEESSLWLHTKKCLEAAEAAINLYALPCPILHHTPLGICGITMSTLANLSACAYVLRGKEWIKTRDRIRLGLGGLKAFGAVWQVSRQTEIETKKIARAVFGMKRPEQEMDIVDPEILRLTNKDFRLLQITNGGQVAPGQVDVMGWGESGEFNYEEFMNEFGRVG